MLKFLRRQGDTSNTVIGVIMLFMLLVFVGPDVLPTLLARTFPFIDEGVPCSRLRAAEDRATHQSLIGRQAVNPLSLRTEAPSVPSDSDDKWVIRIIVQNNTIGTVPLVFDGQERIGFGSVPDSSGLGLVFSPNVTIQQAVPPLSNASLASFNESDIHLLGPRQRCVHRVVIPRNIVNITPGSTVRSYYRINTVGQVLTTNAATPPLFTDQGLAIIEGGIVQSEPVTVEVIFSAEAN